MNRTLRWVALLWLFLASGVVMPQAEAASSTDDPALIREVQGHLKRLGYYQGDIDGQPSRDTRRAIGQFRWNAGMSASKEATPEVVTLLRERAPKATPKGLLLAQQGPLAAYVGPGRWCGANTRVNIDGPAPEAFQQNNGTFQALIMQLRESLPSECARYRRARLTGTVGGADIYIALLDREGALTIRRAPDSRASQQAMQRQATAAAQKRSACATADPSSFDDVFACMASARWTRGLSAGRNRFEGNIRTSACQAIAATYIQVLREQAGLPGDQARQRLPSCETLALAAEELTGKTVYWRNCTGYGSQPVRTHMAQCLEGFVPGYYGDKTPVAAKVTGCATALAAYERGLQSANLQSRLPSGYVRPDCGLVLAMIEQLTGQPSAAVHCRGYHPDNITSHVEQCLDGLPLTSLHSCPQVRRVYETLLVEAHGGLPPTYVTMPCSAAESLLAQAETERADAAERKRTAAMERQRRRTDAEQARQQAKEAQWKEQQAAVQAKLDRAEAQFHTRGQPVPQQPRSTAPLSSKEARRVAQQSALTLNQSVQRDSRRSDRATLPQVDQRKFQPVAAQGSNPVSASPSEFFWTNVGNNLAQAGAGLTQIANIRQELKRHTRNLHDALQVCCSCQYREELQREFVKWKSEELWNEQVVSNAMGAIRERNVDVTQLVPERTPHIDRAQALVPNRCTPPSEIPTPNVKDELTSNGSSLYSRTIDWGVVPDDFVLPSPSYTPNYEVIRYRAHIQVPGRLRTVDLQRFSSNSLSRYGSSNDYMDRAGTEKLIAQDVEFARRQEAFVLHCYYLNTNYLGSEHRLYWYKERPSMTERDYLQARVPDHLLLNVRDPVEACPLSLNTEEM